MNKTFKVVFNRARQGLMVANEITRSVQKNGTKTILVASAVAIASMPAFAASLVKKTWDSPTVPTWGDETSTSTGKITNGVWNVDESMLGSNTDVRGIDMQTGASGQLKDLSLAIATGENCKKKVYGIYNGASDGSKEGAPEFAGESLSISVDSNSDDAAYAFMATKSTKITALKTKTEAKSQSQAVYGVAINGSGAKVKFSGDVDISATIIQPADKAIAYGVYQYRGKTLEIGDEGKKVSICAQVDANEKKSNAIAIYGAMSSTLILKGTAIDIDSTGYGLSTTPGVKTSIGTENTKSLTIDAENVGICATGSTVSTSAVTLSAEEVLINAANVGIEANQKAVINVTGEKKISIKSTNGMGISAGSTSAKIQVGSKQTEQISIETEKEAICAIKKKNTVVLQGNEVALTSNSGDATVWLQSNTEKDTLPKDASSLTVNANQFSVKHKNSETGRALVVLSNSKLCIDADATIEAKQAIATRGNSVITINEDGKKTTKISGDVSFETPWSSTESDNSGKLINSNVNIVFSGKDSYWKGRSYQYYGNQSYTKLENVENYGAVTGFHVTLGEKATWTLTGDSFVNTLTLKDGGKINASQAKILNVGTWDNATSKVLDGFTVAGTGNELILGAETQIGGSIVMSDNAELVTALSTAFTVTKDSNSVVTDASSRFKVALATDATQATLTIPDDFTVTAAALSTMNEAYKAVTLNLENVKVEFESESVKKTTVHTDIITKSVKGRGDLAINSGKTLTISGANETSEVGTIELGVVESGETSPSRLEIKNQTKISVSEIKGNGVVLVIENSSVGVETLSGSSTVSVGEVNGQGATLSVKNLGMTGGSIFVDPAEGFHSTFFVESLGTENTLNTNITVGNGGLVVFGSATESEANAAIASLVGLSSSPSAVVYTTKATTLGSSGSVVIDSNLTAAETTNVQKLVVRNVGTLVIDQAALNGAMVFKDATNVVLAGAANFGVVNAEIGEIPLVTGTSDGSDAVTVGTDTTISVYTDSPFLTATLANDTGIITIEGSSDSEGKAVIASLGIQSMIRRADMILAETIADRAAETDPGSNLWVMVRGERYEQDSLGDGAGLHANMGYGAFGAEFSPNEKTNIGLAFQYGHGTVKGDVGSAKNKTKDYSAALYGSALLGDTGIKLLGELAYTQSSNDITNTYYTGLNQDLDAKMISGGVTLQKRFDFESFSLTPSIGARVSKLKTDAMKLGVNKLDKQSQTIVQVPIALRLAGKTAETENGWSITPRFKVAYIPTFGDKEIDIYGVKKTVLDTSPVQGAFGINFQKGGFSIDATANAGVGNRGTSSIGGKLEMNYCF